jgi:hypothetical protein
VLCTAPQLQCTVSLLHSRLVFPCFPVTSSSPELDLNSWITSQNLDAQETGHKSQRHRISFFIVPL